MDALIGDTGFVGAILAGQHHFAARFNSRTIGRAGGTAFDTVVCAAAPGSMFEANRFPEHDQRRIDDLIDRLTTIAAERFILISTVATLADFNAEDESSAAFEAHIPYGVHRRKLEAFVESHFPAHLVVRLPALFGPGLKKNFLFDILNPMPSMLTDAKLADLRTRLTPDLAGCVAELYAWNEALALHVIDRSALDASGRRAELDAAIKAAGMAATGFTNPDSRFQYYDMAGLWRDIQRGLAGGVSVLHVAPAPIRAADLFRAVTGRDMPANDARKHAEDMRTGHASLWGRTGPYIADPDDILEAVVAFAREQAPA